MRRFIIAGLTRSLHIILFVLLFGSTQPATPQWNTADRQLDTVTVRKTKEKYTQKGNPAVAFIEEVIKRRQMHNPREHDFYSYESYEQRTFARDNFTAEEAQSNWLFRQADFLTDFIDTVSVAGRSVMPLYSEERVEQIYHRKLPQSEKRVVEAVKAEGVTDMFSEESISNFLGETFHEIDLFQDNVPLLLQRFVSPLATFGPAYYKYYLLDTVVVNNVRCVDVGFAPFNSESFSFTGHLYVTADSTYFIQKASFTTPHHINLNMVNSLTVTQEYARTPDSTRLLTKNTVVVDFNILKNDKGIYARQIVERRNHSFEPPADRTIFKERAPIIERADAHAQPEAFWNEKRSDEIKTGGPTAKALMAKMRTKPLFYFLLYAVDVLVNGYIPIVGDSAYFETGPLHTLVSTNELEGLRVRLGGTTRVNLSRQLFANGYLAYGLGDKKIKGNLLLEYDFEKKKRYRLEYPYHYLRAEYKYDVNPLGQHAANATYDNMFAAFIKRKPDKLLTYMQTAEFSYFREHYNGWSYGIKARHLTEWATVSVPIINYQLPMAHYRSAELEFRLRWALGEKFYQSRNRRYAITMDAPVIELTHTTAFKDVLGGDFKYDRTELSVRKRLWLSPFGFLDMRGRVGGIWGDVPYPLLFIPNTNLSYILKTEAFSLMDPMEFINDRFVAWDVQYHLNGTLFNRIPLLNQLRLREVVGLQGWYGRSVSSYQLPVTSYSMGNVPYMELTFGVENIFRLIRVDYVRRLTYRNHPNVPNDGVRAGVVFSF
ncbi:hypothetical protein SAMD00024442_35_20 [Candidatus Symbiothrix dinenymphae]|nr:hypothetical protein SAMD00024442_35_20 [Candidatus Symbiothrix dinenymphae]